MLLMLSLSARRAWIEIDIPPNLDPNHAVALRKESVDRNKAAKWAVGAAAVALRKESVDRNWCSNTAASACYTSLSARRAWIEIAKTSTIEENALRSLSARRAWIEMEVMGRPSR